MTITIASTGFEQSIICKNEGEKPYTTIKRAIRETVWAAYLQGASSFYVNCQYGVPLWAAEAVCAMKRYNGIRLHIVVPYEEQCRDWSEEQRDRYYTVHQQADSVIFAEKQYSENCYRAADNIMTDNSDCVIVFGKKEEIYICRIAEKKRLPVRFVDADRF